MNAIVRVVMHMRRHGLVRALLLSVVILVLWVICCFASGHDPKLPSAASGKKTLLLFAKNPATWAIVKGGGSGRMIYREATGAFSLDAAGLLPRSSYALVRYANAPPKAEILAKGMSDGRGRLELAGIWQNWTRKFWLVSGKDVVGRVGETGSFRDWRPDRYLFEEKTLGIVCACPEPEEP